MSQDSSNWDNSTGSITPTSSPDSILPKPTLLPPQNSPRKPTLVLDLDKILIHSSEDQDPDNPPARYDFIISYEIDGHSKTHYVTKRPGLDDFLEKVSSKYELVIFTASIKEYASLVVDQIDLRGLILFRLYRDSCTVTSEGNYVKDLSELGRNVKKTVSIDTNVEAYAMFPGHVMVVPEFVDNPNDVVLAELGDYLEECYDYEDLREAVDHYA